MSRLCSKCTELYIFTRCSARDFQGERAYPLLKGKFGVRFPVNILQYVSQADDPQGFSMLANDIDTVDARRGERRDHICNSAGRDDRGGVAVLWITQVALHTKEKIHYGRFELGHGRILQESLEISRACAGDEASGSFVHDGKAEKVVGGHDPQRVEHGCVAPNRKDGHGATLDCFRHRCLTNLAELVPVLIEEVDDCALRDDVVQLVVGTNHRHSMASDEREVLGHFVMKQPMREPASPRKSGGESKFTAMPVVVDHALR